MKLLRPPGFVIAILSPMMLLAPAATEATSLLQRTVVDLIALSESIVVGDVLTVTDGLDDGGVPYTEVTLEVEETIRGTLPSPYTFRQFGLLAPRALPDGRTYLGVSPEGWPRFRPGEHVMLFLHSAGAQTGLRTTVGLFQGKLDLVSGRMANSANNAGLFRNVRVPLGLLEATERALLDVETGPVDADAFRSLVRKAVDNRWVEQGVMTDES